MPKIIVLVEDDPTVQKLLTRVLGGDGFQVKGAFGARSGLRLLREQACDLLVCDLKLPGIMSGLDLIGHVRQDYPKIPIVVISGVLSGLPPEDRKTLDEHAVAGIFSKPLNMGAFRHAVAELLNP